MSEEETPRIFTAENVIDLIRIAYDIQVLVNEKTNERIVSTVFEGANGPMRIASKGPLDDPELDTYNQVYMLVYQIAEIKRGEVPSGNIGFALDDDDFFNQLSAGSEEEDDEA